VDSAERTALQMKELIQFQLFIRFCHSLTPSQVLLNRSYAPALRRNAKTKGGVVARVPSYSSMAAAVEASFARSPPSPLTHSAVEALRQDSVPSRCQQSSSRPCSPQHHCFKVCAPSSSLHFRLLYM
jgi:hypothetical protein